MVISDEELLKVGAESFSVSNMMVRLGLIPMGSNHKQFRDRARRLNITFKKREVPFQSVSLAVKPIEYYLVLNCPSKVTSSKLRRRLIREGLKKNECEECGQGPVWNSKPLNFHLEHRNGNHHDNRLENLQILCPNCHTQTLTYGALKQAGKGRRIRVSRASQTVTEKTSGHYCECGAEIRKRNKYGLCLKCYGIKFPRPRKVLDRPSLEVLQADINELGYSGTGRKYDVSDNAIRKWLKVLSHPS